MRVMGEQREAGGMAKRTRALLGDAFDLVRLAAEAWLVVGLRSAKLAAGGPAALIEAHRMMAEKSAAALEAQTAAGLALALGQSPRAAQKKALGRYRRRVKANRRRLMGKR